jgi:dTDP-4-dehydrorhamnose reductase
MKVLILGVTGMLGNAMFRVLSGSADLVVYGTARSNSARQHFSNNLSEKIITEIDVESNDSLVRAFATVRPDVVIS